MCIKRKLEKGDDMRKNIAIVTGASCGMGREFVRQLAKKEPCIEEIWAVARNRTALEALQREVPSVRIFSTDMTKQASFDSLKLVLEKEKPHISWLVCSAGAGTQKEVAKTECRDLENMIQLNCTALTLMTRLCLPYCRNGQILLLASGAAFVPQPGFAVYAASKAYVLSFARALRRELKGQVRVTAVCPGPVDTPFLDKMGGREHMPAFKKPFIASPHRVVRKAIKDGKKGRELSVYGISMRVTQIFCKLLPHRIMINIMYKSKRGVDRA